MRLSLPLVLLLSACGSTWTQKDVDGDGFTPAQGDCWDSLDVVPGSKLKGAQIHPNAAEIWYDGVDQDCGGEDDYDADGDGWLPHGAYVAQTTYGVARSGQGHKGAGDCWDAPLSADPPDEYAVVSEDLAGVAWIQPTAAEVHPGVAGGDDTPNTGQLQDTWYDGVDQDCAEDDDFDADLDGWRSDAWPDATGALGEDCIDGGSADADNPSEAAAAAVNPDAAEIWYDGTDDDCDTDSTVDCDLDGDGYRADPNFLLTPEESPCLFSEDELLDCRDDDDAVYPDPTVDEIPYNGVDDNCDTTDLDGDKDGDGEWAVDYLAVLAARGITHDDTVTVPDDPGDCWDDEDVSPENAGEGAELRVLDGFDALVPAAVYRGAEDRPYDGADQDCLEPDADSDGVLDDFDWDLDGDEVEIWPSRDGATGGDCLDCPADCFDGSWEGTTAQDWCDDLCALQDPNAGGLDPADIHTGATETWYDGTDADCDDVSDNDADMDGEDHEAAGGTDCLEGTTLDADLNPAALDPSLVNAAATETWYDGTDSDCDDASDDDADGDGYDHLAQGGTDCIEDTSLDTTPNDGELDPADVYPGATDVWYDGTDADCSASSDYDADRDGYDHEIGGGTDCFEGTTADVDGNPVGLHPAAIHPGAVEVWYDGTDANCDDNDGDADGDGHVWADYAFTAASGDPVDDCDDTAATTYPGASEVPGDEIDQDCDETEVCYVDADGDGVRVDSATIVASDDLDCTDDGEGQLSDVAGDCDDSDETVAPGLSELCDGLDNDCDGAVPADELDGDSDGWVTCIVDTDGWDAIAISGGEDCDDADDTVHPSGDELCDGVDNDCEGTIPDDELDLDGDGYVECTIDSGGWDGIGISGGDDCDDDETSTYPGAPETAADGIDQDCDGTESCYVDVDGDGFHDGATMTVSADADCDDAGEADSSSSSGECDDTDATIHPGATELSGDGVDQDCDGTEVCYLDSDDDGYRPDTTSTVASADSDCEDPTEALTTDPSGDCDDSDAAIHPGATELCDALDADEDCNGTVEEADPGLDETTASTWYLDIDVDGYGDEFGAGTVSCDDPSGALTYRIDATDCDDTDATISPAATEVCDDADVDEDCDDLADDADSSVSATGKTTWYADTDTDGFGDVTVSSVLACDDPSDTITYVADATDCDDSDTAVNPDATEICDNGIDDDCDGGPGECDTLGDVDLLTSSDGRWLGVTAGDAAGTTVAALGDVIGSTTVGIGAPGVDGAGTNRGAAYLASGLITGDVSLSTAIEITGAGDGDSVGRAMSVGDIDGDSQDDLILGVLDEGSGVVYLLLGPVTASQDLSSNDATLYGAGSEDAGASVLGSGDLNGDGIGDLLVGAPARSSAIGAVYGLLGPLSGDASVRTEAFFTLQGEATGDEAGTSIANAGDTDGDGGDDFLIGAWGNDAGGADAGAAYLLTGPVTGLVVLSAADVIYTGTAADDGAGYALGAAGDVDGDGLDDMLIGGPFAGTFLDGTAWLVLGSASATGTVSLSGAQATFTAEAEGDLAGVTVESAGDVNADGFDDLLIGATENDGSGTSYLVLGPATGTIALSAADARLVGDIAGDTVGAGLAGLGDLDSNGYDDIVVGASGESTAASAAGAASLIMGGGL